MIVCATLTDRGNREINEDSIRFDADAGFFVLADGLGGHGYGDVASRIVTEYAISYFGRKPGDLNGCFLESQNRLIDEQRKMNASDEMKTTMVCLYISDGKALWGHVGDSRLYHFKAGKLNKRTIDHSVTQMLVTMGEIREKDIRGHVDRNRLLRVMGTDWDVPKYELGQEVELGSKDAFLLCSDGFWEWINESAMEKTLKKSGSPNQWIEAMKKIVIKNGAGKNMDNFSAIAVFT